MRGLLRLLWMRNRFSSSRHSGMGGAKSGWGRWEIEWKHYLRGDEKTTHLG